MTTRVAVAPALPTITQIQGGKIVGGTEWSTSAALLNHILGCGSCVLPAHDPGLSSGIAAAASRDFRYRTVLQAQTVALAWIVRLRSRATLLGTVVDVTAPAATGTTRARTVTVSRLSAPIVYIEPRASQSSSEVEVNIRIAPVTQAVDVESIACYAMPRGSLSVAGTDAGIDDSTCMVRQPICDAGANIGKSLGETARGITGALTIARRVGLIQLGLPDTDGDTFQVTTAAPAWQTLYTGGAPVLTRKLYRTDTTGTVSWRALVKCSGGLVAGSIRATAVSGGTSTITIPAGTTSYTWMPAVANPPATFSVDCEDLTDAAGRRSSRWDDVTFDANYSVLGTIYVATISCWEA